MNAAFNTVITASQAERRDLFLAAAARLGTAGQSMLLMNIIPVSFVHTEPPRPQSESLARAIAAASSSLRRRLRRQTPPVWATEQTFGSATDKVHTHQPTKGICMTNDSTTEPKTRRIAGTLHKRGYATPVPSRDEKLPGERAQVNEVEDKHRDSGQKDRKAASPHPPLV